MKPRKFRLAFAHFPYSGNGGATSEVPYVRHWKEAIIPWMLKDDRIEGYVSKDFADTPICMTRNAAVMWARRIGADFLIMVDSDMWPDRYLGHPEKDAVPFLQSSFDYAYKHWDQKMLCIFSPYAGKPPEECVFVFRWIEPQADHPDDQYSLEMYSRDQAFQMGGFHEAGAGPTGLMMTDMRLFEMNDPVKVKEDLGLEFLKHPGWFYYEFTDDYGWEKASTEDVTFTREISQCGITKLGYNPLICNWSAWSAHMKFKAVGMPELTTADKINERLVAAVKSGRETGKKLRNVDFVAGIVSEGEVIEFDPATVNHEHDPSSPPYQAVERVVMGHKVTSLVFTTGHHDLLALAQLAHKVPEEGLIVELGSWVGESAIVMHEGSADKHARVFAVDPHLPFLDTCTCNIYGNVTADEVHQTFCKNTAKLDRLTHIRKLSTDAAASFRNKSIHLLFVDAGHDRQSIEADLKAWFPKMHPDGVIAFHDYKAELFPEVEAVVHEWFRADRVVHPPGTSLGIVRVDHQKVRKMAKDCGPAKGAKSPPKGGPGQKMSKPKGGPIRKGK